MTRRRSTRSLRPEEVELWRRVQQSATPLHGPFRADPEPAPRDTTVSKEGPMSHRTDLDNFSTGSRVPAGPVRPGPAASQAVRMDAKAFDRMRRGKLAVEGRLDLHGMTLAQAHPRLIDFVLDAHGRGKRLVLVITGKGGSGDDEWAIPSRRGILRRQVPQWLGSGALRTAVLQIAPAHRGHGGDGAFYVYLRRRR